MSNDDDMAELIQLEKSLWERGAYTRKTGKIYRKQTKH